jgi:signal peptidase I
MRVVLRTLARTLPAVLTFVLAVVGASLFGCVVIAGGSMAPTLAPGDVLVFRRPPVDVATHDVVLLRRPDWQRGVVHRIVSVTATGGLVTKGDANPVADLDPVPYEAVRGRGVVILPLGRLAQRLAGLTGSARLLLQHLHSDAMTETAFPRFAPRPQGETPSDWEGLVRRRVRFTPSAAT